MKKALSGHQAGTAQWGHTRALAAIAALPFIAALATWLGPLAFIPVPWPDDSAFYFVAKDFFHWPPRWVMLPQAPFEPTYRIFNFNTMPLYPFLIGIARAIGIDGSFALKILPLTAWAASGSLLAWVLGRRGLSLAWVALVAAAVGLDPELRWASVLVRPESLIGLLGVALVLGVTFGFPERLRPRGIWDPVAALLVLGAYAHFNAVHLLAPAVVGILIGPEPWRRLWAVAYRGILYLAPWFVAVLWHWGIFWVQMHTQWQRLAIENHWLDEWSGALSGLFQALGSPIPWPSYLNYAAAGLWIAIFGAAFVIGVEGRRRILLALGRKARVPGEPSLLPAAAWVFSALWLWHTKPEVWFVFYIHLAVWVFVGIALVRLRGNRAALVASAALTAVVTLFVAASASLWADMGKSGSWRWSTYRSFVDCIDSRLEAIRGKSANKGAFEVWAPTFPDVTVELSRKHPDWDLTRTNDFAARNSLAIQHGWNADAVVVTETLGWAEKDIDAPLSEHPEVRSLWLNWRGYYINDLYATPGWKPKRWLCQRGRWQGFIFSD